VAGLHSLIVVIVMALADEMATLHFLEHLLVLAAEAVELV
jgi:hypothetical protein